RARLIPTVATAVSFFISTATATTEISPPSLHAALPILEELEGEVIPVLREGSLSRAPAFGSAPGAAERALPEYLEFHAATWRNLQYLRGTLHGLATALAAAAEEEDRKSGV